MKSRDLTAEELSPWWKHAVVLIMTLGFTILIWRSVQTYSDAPPIPQRAVTTSGETVFTRDDIVSGQSVFLKYGLMDNGTVWGHGAYLGPDFSADYLHTLSIDLAESGLDPAQVQSVLKENRYDPQTGTLTLTNVEAESFSRQINRWQSYFNTASENMGLPEKFIDDRQELRQLTAFFAWTAWASTASRPGKTFSYTNNFPYDPSAGNNATGSAVLWSALSLVALLGGIGVVLFAFGKFNFLGWKTDNNDHVHPEMLPGIVTQSQRATLKYFIVVIVLFLAQVLVGGATAHYRADATSFYGINIANLLPSNLLRTWHIQLAVFWIATAFIGGGLLLAPTIGGGDPKRQAFGVNLLFWALVVVVGGSLSGEALGINRMLGKLWFWFGHQGWEYLELGRAWQVLLAVGLVIWLVLLFRAVAQKRNAEKAREIASLFLYAALAIPLFYLPAFFFDSSTHFSVVDTWRFWIIHLWVEGFFELFATVMVAIIFYYLGIVSDKTAARVVYLDAVLYLGSGIVGTGHHWYWTGQSDITMALGALFSALEVVPLTLLTLDAWDFVKLSEGHCDVCGRAVSVPHRWTFYFLMSVGFWNFLGAGVFGFLINMPIVSYFEVGTTLTPNHGHAAMMGVFGMLAIALVVFAMRQISTDDAWAGAEKYVRVSFWGLNAGLLLMVILNLFPGGILQLLDVFNNGYWHARSPIFMSTPTMRFIEWLRMPADLVFIGFGVVPLLIAGLRVFKASFGAAHHQAAPLPVTHIPSAVHGSGD